MKRDRGKPTGRTKRTKRPTVTASQALNAIFRLEPSFLETSTPHTSIDCSRHTSSRPHTSSSPPRRLDEEVAKKLLSSRATKCRGPKSPPTPKRVPTASKSASAPRRSPKASLPATVPASSPASVLRLLKSLQNVSRRELLNLCAPGRDPIDLLRRR